MNIYLLIYIKKGFAILPYRMWSGYFNNGVSHWKDRETPSCSGCRTGCLCNLNVSLEPWKIPGELLAFTLLWNPEKVRFTTDLSSRIGKLASEMGVSRQKAKFPSSVFLLSGLPLKVLPRFRWVFLLQIMWLRSSLTGVSSIGYHLFPMYSSWQLKLVFISIQ